MRWMKWTRRAGVDDYRPAEQASGNPVRPVAPVSDLPFLLLPSAVEKGEKEGGRPTCST